MPGFTSIGGPTQISPAITGVESRPEAEATMAKAEYIGQAKPTKTDSLQELVGKLMRLAPQSCAREIFCKLLGRWLDLGPAPFSTWSRFPSSPF